jgi:outer membrane receptor protein involved in Fe transport
MLSLLILCVSTWVASPARSQSGTESTAAGQSDVEKASGRDDGEEVADSDTDSASDDAYAEGDEPYADGEDPYNDEYDDEYLDDSAAAADTSAAAADAYKDLEEITITGSKSSGLEKATISTTSFNAGEIHAMRIQDISDIAKFTPGLEINTAFAASNPTLFIRGIGLKDYNANSAGAVAVYRDGVALNSPVGQLFQLFDVKNVTVMKGPQSGRYGRNATAGAIAIESNRPDGEWSSEGSYSAGNYNSTELTGAIGFPIIEDKFSGRVAFNYNRRDGHTRNGCAGWDPVAHGQQVVSEDAIRSTYADLNPSPVAEQMYDSSGNPLTRNNGSPVTAYLYQNRPLASSLLGSNYGTFIGDRFYDSSGTQVYNQLTQFSANGGDTICVLNAPGRVWTPAHPTNLPGSWEKFPNVPTLEEFQDLKTWTNNVNDWAARASFLWEPTVNMSWLVLGHYGQNLSDSRHNQLVSATTSICPKPKGEICRSPEDTPHPFQEVNPNDRVEGWTEMRSGEPAVVVKGLKPPPQIGGSSVTEGGERGADPFLGWYDSDGQEFLDVWGAALTGDWDLASYSVQSITAYEANKRLVQDEGDASPRRSLRTDWADDTWQVSQEFIANSEQERLNWRGGLYILYEDLQATNVFPGIFQQRWTQTFDQSLFSIAPYVSGTYEFVNYDNARPALEELSLQVNIRYNYELKKFQLLSEITSSAGVVAGVIQEEPVKEDWHAPTGNVTLRWTPILTETAALEVHTGYSRGWKTGHFNASLTINPGDNQQQTDEFESALTPVKPETMHAFELGFKSELLKQRVVLEAAFFRYWYRDMQVFDLVNEPNSVPTQQLLSADARILGVEANITVLPVEGLELGLGMNWLDSTFEDFFVSKREAGGRNNRSTRTFDYSGNPTIAAPRWTVNGFAVYDIPLGRWGSLTPRFDYNYKSQTFLDPQGLDLIAQPEYWLFDARLSYFTPDERVEFAFWITNISDQEFLVDVFDVSREFSTILQVWGEPRMFGATVSYRF